MIGSNKLTLSPGALKRAAWLFGWEPEKGPKCVASLFGWEPEKGKRIRCVAVRLGPCKGPHNFSCGCSAEP